MLVLLFYWYNTLYGILTVTYTTVWLAVPNYFAAVWASNTALRTVAILNVFTFYVIL